MRYICMKNMLGLLILVVVCNLNAGSHFSQEKTMRIERDKEYMRCMEKLVAANYEFEQEERRRFYRMIAEDRVRLKQKADVLRARTQN